MFKKAVIILIALYIFILLGFYFFQDNIIFRPKKISKNYIYTFSEKFEEIELKISDKTSINALHFKVVDPKGIILYFHGNKGDLIRWGNIVKPFTDYNYDVFVMDYRGYGKSTGKRTEEMMYSDAQSCYDYVSKLYNESNIIVYGRSLGGTFASFVASKNNPKQLILEATFYSMTEVIRNKLPILPYSKLLKFKFETDKFIGHVKAPTIIFHGTEDRLVSVDLGKKLFERSNKENTEFVEIEGATHHNIGEFQVYNSSLKNILK
jgi:fermentation-respiration switch protein FrsA (DUF1100 family)